MKDSEKGVEKAGQVGTSKPPPHSPVTDPRNVRAPVTRTEPAALSETPPAPVDEVLTGQVEVDKVLGVLDTTKPSAEQGAQVREQIAAIKEQALARGEKPEPEPDEPGSS